MAITYKTVIANAIADFNNIQTELYKLGAKRADGTTAITNTSGTLVPTAELDDIISGQLQLKATGTYTLTDNLGTTDLSAYKYVVAQPGAYSASSSNSITAPTVSVSGTANGFTESESTTPYYVTINGSGRPGSITSTATATVGTAGWIETGSKTGSKTDTITPSISGNGNKIYIPAGLCTITGGGLSSSGSNVTLSDTNNGISFTVTRAAVTDAHTAGYIPEKAATTAISSGTITKYITGLTVPKDVAFSISMTADTAADTTSNLTITNAAYRTISINGGNKDKGVLINGANGKTATVDGTTVTNANGDLLAATIDVNDLTITPNALSGSWNSSSNAYIVSQASKTAKMQSTVTSAGWISSSIGTKNTGTATVSAPSNLSIPRGTLSAASKADAEDTSGAYKDYYNYDTGGVQTAPVLSSGGYLIIGAGYYPNSKISLKQLIPDDTNYSNANGNQIRSGYEAFDVDGNKIVGTIADYTPSDTYYTDTNTGFGLITGNSYVTTSSRYIKAGSATAPANISGTSSAVSISSGTVTLTKTVSVTPVVSAGWVSSGTAGNSKVTLSGTIATTSRTAGNGSCTITANSTKVATSDTITNMKALCYNTASEAGSSYVLVTASGSGTVSTGTGYIESGSTRSNTATDTNYIPAVKSPSVSVSASTSNIGVGSATTFASDTGSVSAAGSKSGTFSVTLNESSKTNVDNKYVVGALTVNKTGTSGTASINTDATGSNVDTYVEALYKRMLGKTYTEVSADA